MTTVKNKVIPITPAKKQYNLNDIKPSSQAMALIIKPTEKCNFKCTFCSSSQITENDSNALLDLEMVYAFLKRYPHTNTIIVNGGDPLVVPIKYYWELIDHLEKNDLPTTLSFTSNLWPFKVNPEKWTPLLRHKLVGVTTSFHYGDTRLKNDMTPFTEKEFWEVSDLMLERIGYRPDFISVIDKDNYDRAIDNVKLAKEMGVQCKLNPAVISGRQEHMVSIADMYKLYVEIYRLGLAEWEHNTQAMISAIDKCIGVCPIARKCDSGIRALQPEGDYYTCGSFADERKYGIDFDKEILEGEFNTPLTDDTELFSMTDWCMSCDLFNLCNGCRKTISDHKKQGMTEKHCAQMKSIEKDIKWAAADCKVKYDVARSHRKEEAKK